MPPRRAHHPCLWSTATIQSIEPFSPCPHSTQILLFYYTWLHPAQPPLVSLNFSMVLYTFFYKCWGWQKLQIYKFPSWRLNISNFFISSIPNIPSWVLLIIIELHVALITSYMIRVVYIEISIGSAYYKSMNIYLWFG